MAATCESAQRLFSIYDIAAALIIDLVKRMDRRLVDTPDFYLYCLGLAQPSRFLSAKKH
ncbi:hypothetical protein VIC_002556 [Vibrio coralliilyticus ATCC BAA-450]|nr:hypothetical protein VIC_002556 [Vibrio coralliilyticus ATCC BAA-450]